MNTKKERVAEWAQKRIFTVSLMYSTTLRFCVKITMLTRHDTFFIRYHYTRQKRRNLTQYTENSNTEYDSIFSLICRHINSFWSDVLYTQLIAYSLQAFIKCFILQQILRILISYLLHVAWYLSMDHGKNPNIQSSRRLIATLDNRFIESSICPWLSWCLGLFPFISCLFEFS